MHQRVIGIHRSAAGGLRFALLGEASPDQLLPARDDPSRDWHLSYAVLCGYLGMVQARVQAVERVLDDIKGDPALAVVADRLDAALHLRGISPPPTTEPLGLDIVLQWRWLCGPHSPPSP